MITKKTCTSYGILYLTSLDLKIYSKYSKSKLSLLTDHMLQCYRDPVTEKYMLLEKWGKTIRNETSWAGGGVVAVKL